MKSKLLEIFYYIGAVLIAILGFRFGYNEQYVEMFLSFILGILVMIYVDIDKIGDDMDDRRTNEF